MREVRSVLPLLPYTEMSRTRLNQIYIWLVVLAGTAALLFSLREFPVAQLDVRFLVMALATVLVGPRLSIQIPRVRAHISVSDTFIFLTLLLFGGEAAIILATVEALCSSVRISKQVSTHFFNAGATACFNFSHGLVAAANFWRDGHLAGFVLDQSPRRDFARWPLFST